MEKIILTKELVEDLYKTKSIKQIGKELGFSDRTIKSFMLENGIEIKSRNIDKLDENISKSIENLYKNGLNPREIAEKLNLTQSKVKSYLVSNNIWEKNEELNKVELLDMNKYQKLSIREIAKIKNCSIKKVQLALNKYNIKRLEYKFNEIELKTFLDLGFSINAIAQKKNVSRYIISKAIRNYGLA